MAETHEESRDGSGTRNRTLVAIIALLVLVPVVIGLLKGSEEPSTEPPLPPGNARALVVPSDDDARTVVIAPCGTAVEETARDAREDQATPNTIRFEFPRGGGDRAVLVPDCSPQSGVSGSASGLPVAAFILPVGTKENRLHVPPLRAESQLLVPRDGEARTVVMGPCTGQVGGEAGRPAPASEGGTNQDAVLEPEEGQGDLVTAPQC